MATREQSFKRLRAETWMSGGSFRTSLARTGSRIQSLADGAGDCVHDEYSILIDQMPPGSSPEHFLSNMAADLNGTVADAGFNAVNVFRRSAGGKPIVGEIIYIDIAGPINGSVVLVESGLDYFIFQTVNTEKSGPHPENGSREFGFERTGAYTKFYTRGVSRPGNVLIRFGGAGPQAIGWARLCRGLSDAIKARGGAPVDDSFAVFKQNRPY